MNKAGFVYNSQKSFPISQYLQMTRSKEVQDEVLRKYSRSPQNSQQSKQTSKEYNELAQIKQKYKQLQMSYEDLLDKVKKRNEERQKIKSQLQHYQRLHEKDTEEIDRLRCIIGLIKRKNAQVQVNSEQLNESISFMKNSRINKFDQSTQDDIRMKNSAQKFHSSDKKELKKKTIKFEENSFCKQSRKQPSFHLKSSKQLLESQIYQPSNMSASISSKNLLLKYQKEIQQKNFKRLSNSPYSKLRFVPSNSNLIKK